VDLWQAGGRAVLGHNPAGIFRDFKNYAGRGLFAPLPHPQERRLAAALSRLLPGRIFRFYTDRLSLRSVLEAAGFPWGPLPDPAFPPLPAGVPALWRPFLGEQPPAPVLIPVLPWPLAPWVLAPEAALEDRFPPSDPIPPAVLAAAARSVYDLIAAGNGGGRPVYPGINRALYGTSAGPWRRRGIYLTRQGEDAADGWEDLYRRFLAGGFLIPPGPAEPLILPGALSPGEEAKLAALLRS
jgi:hypothetical protein